MPTDHRTFLLSAGVQRLVDRAAASAAMPVSLHAANAGGEGERLGGCGGCAACGYVNRLRWGGQSCTRSREKAAAMALRRSKPIPFLCHMGFSCVSMAAIPGDADGGVLTFGPFCPAEAPGSLELDAREGLEQLLREPVEELPFTLADIPMVSAKAVPSIAEWTAESIGTLAETLIAKPDPPTVDHEDESLPRQPVSRGRAAKPVRQAYQAGDLLLALTGGNAAQARLIVRALVMETPAGKRRSQGTKRARAGAIAASVFEAAERAGHSTDVCRARLTECQGRLGACGDERALSVVLLHILRPLKPRKGRAHAMARPRVKNQSELDRILSERFADGITLNEAAAILGEHPTAITHRLQRAYGLSFTEYLGRMRVDRAKDLLRKTQLDVREVARRVGLTDGSNFARVFRRHEGMSPLEYRDAFGQRASPVRTKR